MDAAKLAKRNGNGKSKNGSAPAGDSDSEWDNFHRLTDKLLRVPKREIDEKRKKS
jgi:hypothetical protein